VLLLPNYASVFPVAFAAAFELSVVVSWSSSNCVRKALRNPEEIEEICWPLKHEGKKEARFIHLCPLPVDETASDFIGAF